MNPLAPLFDALLVTFVVALATSLFLKYVVKQISEKTAISYVYFALGAFAYFALVVRAMFFLLVA